MESGFLYTAPVIWSWVLLDSDVEEFDSITRSIVVFELSGADPVVMATNRLPCSPMKTGWVSVNFIFTLRERWWAAGAA